MDSLWSYSIVVQLSFEGLALTAALLFSMEESTLLFFALLSLMRLSYSYRLINTRLLFALDVTLCDAVAIDGFCEDGCEK